MPIHLSVPQDADSVDHDTILDGLLAAMRGEVDCPLSACILDTPIGRMIAIAGRTGLHMLEFVDGRGTRTSVARLLRRLDARVAARTDPHLSETAAQIAEYFEGRRRAFDLSISAVGTERQRRAWRYVSAIPYGDTRSYSDLASALGNARAVRAAGSANAANPVSIVVPCHRVVGANGVLTGYGGGLERKRWLLEHERRVTVALAASPSGGAAAPSRPTTRVRSEDADAPRVGRSRTRERP